MKPNHPPPILSAIAFAVFVFTVVMVIVGGMAVSAQANLVFKPESEAEFSAQLETIIRAKEQQETRTTVLSLATAVASALLAAWAWCSPAETRFQCAFWSGVALFIITSVYILQLRQEPVDGSERYWIAIAPVLTVFAVLTGLVLLLTALALDPASSRTRKIA